MWKDGVLVLLALTEGCICNRLSHAQRCRMLLTQLLLWLLVASLAGHVHFSLVTLPAFRS